jgi:hypothetical protein
VLEFLALAACLQHSVVEALMAATQHLMALVQLVAVGVVRVMLALPLPMLEQTAALVGVERGVK